MTKRRSTGSKSENESLKTRIKQFTFTDLFNWMEFYIVSILSPVGALNVHWPIRNPREISRA